MAHSISPRKSDFQVLERLHHYRNSGWKVGETRTTLSSESNMAAPFVNNGLESCCCLLATFSDFCAIRLSCSIYLYTCYVALWNASYHEVCCYMQALANSANADNGRVHLAFQTNKWKVVHSNMASFLATLSDSWGKWKRTNSSNAIKAALQSSWINDVFRTVSRFVIANENLLLIQRLIRWTKAV